MPETATISLFAEDEQMTHEQAKQAFSVIHKLAGARPDRIVSADGKLRAAPGTIKQTGYEYWKTENIGGDFDSWWREMYRLATSKGAARPQPKYKRAHGILERYREYALKYDSMPIDAQCIDEWKCSSSALTSARRRLTDIGFAFSYRDGVYHVLRRPTEPPPAQPATPPAQPATPPAQPAASPAQPATLPTSLPSVENKLDRIAELLEKLIGVWA